MGVRDNEFERVLLMGPPLAGKRTALEALGRAVGALPSDFEHSEAGFRNVGTYVTTSFHDRSFRIATFSGAVSHINVWMHYALRAYVIMLLLDSQRTQLSRNLRIVAALRQAAPLVQPRVLWTKGDLTGGMGPAPALRRALRELADVTWQFANCGDPEGRDGAHHIRSWLEGS